MIEVRLCKLLSLSLHGHLGCATREPFVSKWLYSMKSVRENLLLLPEMEGHKISIMLSLSVKLDNYKRREELVL